MLKFVFFDLDGTLGYVSNRRMFTKCFIDNLVEVALEEIKLDRKIVAETFLKVMWDIRMNPPLTSVSVVNPAFWALRRKPSQLGNENPNLKLSIILFLIPRFVKYVKASVPELLIRIL